MLTMAISWRPSSTKLMTQNLPEVIEQEQVTETLDEPLSMHHCGQIILSKVSKSQNFVIVHCQ